MYGYDPHHGEKFGKAIVPVVMGMVFHNYVDPYRDDPVGWIEDVAGAFLWSKQKEIARSIASNPYTAVKACHGVGKSWLMAHIIAWWVCTHPYEETLCLFTAPTFNQVWSIIGKELGILHKRAKLPGKLLKRNTEWWINGVLVAQGLKPDDNNEDAFQGRHATYTLGIGDEADGLPGSIWTGLDAIATTDGARTCVIGNPMKPTGKFATVCGDNVNADKAEAWESVLTVNAMMSPAFTGEVVPDNVLPKLVQKSWVERRRIRWGEGSMLWEGRVMGRFPKSDVELLIDPGWILSAVKRELPGIALGRMAMDVARFGDSETVLYRNRGGQIRFISGAFSSSGPEVKRMARSALDSSSKAVAMNIDGDGVGGPIYDDLHEEEYPVFEFRGGHSPSDKEDFADLRSETYWTLREGFRKGQYDLDRKDKVLIAQLGNIQWKLTRDGKIKVESKDEMRKRGVSSPDRADGAMMTACHLGDSEYQIERGMNTLTKQAGVGSGSMTADLLDDEM